MTLFSDMANFADTVGRIEYCGAHKMEIAYNGNCDYCGRGMPAFKQAITECLTVLMEKV
ncbi:predicted protein [Plenodomus lingam JN3]|uniref:Uncharacterized protein n=1 Tax=Leptosphaeria maculans (strain JN3 / isolate v23.1.3 / race Av1-4-5-6-7-8) TaxID=985895 RepID=E5A6J1_LEPMJ|nr:predicted protein [Plenodomus lingam JN3]CBX99236.1 predicted protein [Plenodomus lingam JN3]